MQSHHFSAWGLLFVCLFIVHAEVEEEPSYKIFVDGKSGTDAPFCVRGGSTPCRSISYALAYAPTDVGAITINLASGKYTGPLNTNLKVNRRMTILGPNIDKLAVIDCQSSGSGFMIGPNVEVLIVFIEIRNCRGWEGAAIHAAMGSQVNVYLSRFVDNHATNAGGAISAAGQNAIVLVSGSYFGGNSASSDGGAIAVKNAHHFVAISSTFEDNYAVTGGAIYLDMLSGAMIYSVVFMNNLAEEQAGAIYSDAVTIFSIDEQYPSAMMNNCIIADYYDSYKAQFYCSNCAEKIQNVSGCLDVKPKRFSLSEADVILVVVALPLGLVSLICIGGCIYVHRRQQAHVEVTYKRVFAMGWSVL